MSDATQAALVLADDSVAHSDPVHFAGFPGLWVKGQPVAVSELGFADADAAATAVADAGVPLEAATVAAGEGRMPDTGKLPGDLEARQSGWKPQPGQPGGELAPGAVFPAAPARADEEQLAELAMLDQNAADAIEAVNDYDGPAAVLDQLAAAERAGKNRTTVLQAIDARLAPDTEGVE